VARVDRLWPGSTIVCIGSGPSLTDEDVAYCRDKARVIAINNNYQKAPWADVLYAADFGWWKAHDGVPSFQGLKVSITQHPNPKKRYADVRVLTPVVGGGLDADPSKLRTGQVAQSAGNSGFQAINLAVHLGANRILLLGYDMQRGKTGSHWHPRHTHNELDPPVSSFLKSFPTLVDPLKKLGVSVINCSRATALHWFPKQPIDHALRQTVAA
jgi:hypothetical protein